MKKLLSLFGFAAVLFLASCSDDDENALPVLIAPGTVSTDLGEEGTADFTFTAEAGFASATVEGTGVDVTITTSGTTGETTGTITVTYTVTALGSNSVVLTVIDGDGNGSEATLIVDSNDFTTITVSGNISENTTWEATNVYQLSGRVSILDGATLTIEAGTIIKAEDGLLTNASVLIVARGGKLMAMGTADAPIIFTAVSDEIVPGQIESPNLTADINGRWGGLIVLGKAPISASNDNDEDISEVQIEGIPTTDTNGLYGGTDAADNSGTIQYISLRHGGTELGSGNEINGLTLGGVGSGTTITHIEIVGNKDDGIEWFGGNVDVSNVVVWNAGDDGLDTDQDWVGTCSDFIIVTPVNGSAFELDGPEGSTSRGRHTFDNGTVYAGELGEELVDLDGSTNANMTNIYFYGISTTIVVESFGGADGGTFSGWEYTLPSDIAVADVFVDVPASALTEVAENANSVGPDASNFGWTWAATSGALSDIGL